MMVVVVVMEKIKKKCGSDELECYVNLARS